MELNIHKGDYAWVPEYYQPWDFTKDPILLRWRHGPIIWYSPETQDDPAFVSICVDGNEYGCGLHKCVIDERKTQAARAAIANAKQVEAGQLRLQF